ncbi:MAG: hypothetical protein QG629_331 [Patescibacteria group bacterium]|nr:hypothetical protein [Patescibacteria group bacterium]
MSTFVICFASRYRQNITPKLLVSIDTHNVPDPCCHKNGNETTETKPANAHENLENLVNIFLAESLEYGVCPAKARLTRVHAFLRWLAWIDDVVFF